MKMLKNIILVSAVILTLGLMGCRTAPIYNLESAPVNVSSSASLVDIKKSIISAGAALGWQMKEVEPGHIVGTLYLRKHMAKVDIPYSKTGYSITYKDSLELNYDGTVIHKNYNGWIQNLDRGIQARLTAL